MHLSVKNYFFAFCFLMAGKLSAQIVTNNRILQQSAVGFKLSFDYNYAKAKQLAKEKGWPLIFTNNKGNLAQLVGVDDLGFPKYVIANNNTIAAATTRANQLWPGGSTGLNLTGSSDLLKYRIGVWDGGSVYADHVELTAARVLQKDNPSSIDNHATHITGTMIANGTVPEAKGMAYGAKGLVAYDFLNDNSEIASEAGNLVVSNHSYSIISGWNFNSSQNRWEFMGRPNETEDYKFGYYSTDSQILDSIAYNAPNFLMVKSAGNNRDEIGPSVGSPYFRYNNSGVMASAGNRPSDISSNNGFDIISWDCGAKNILTVGAVNGIPTGYSRKEDVVMSSFSSWGPTDDGRIKPDIVADGVGVFSPIASAGSYAAYSGTSMSAPNATGSLFLIQEYYAKLKGGSFLRSATLKGLAIHTAQEAGDAPGPDYKFGWGLLNVEKVANALKAAIGSNNASSSEHLVYENELAQNASASYTVIASGKGALQATICWTDPKGEVISSSLAEALNNRTKKLINDLDIRITKGSGASLRTYLPWTLDGTNPNAPALPGDNITDNVERIDVDSTIPGTSYQITITHKGSLARGKQAYSLLISGVGGTAYCTSASGGGGAKIDSVILKTIKFGNTAGSKTYTDNTHLITDVEPGQSLPITIKTNTAGVSSNPRMVKVWIDLNNNGIFETGENLATSAVLAATPQTYTANLAIPTNAVIGNICLMRIIVQETSLATDINPCANYAAGETQDYRIRIGFPSNDVTIAEIVSPIAGDCATDNQYITIKIKNNGSVAQSNIPVTALLKTGGNTIANLSFTYPGPIAASATQTYTFQTPINTLASTVYDLTVTTNLSTDQYSANNSLVSNFTTAAKPSVASAVASICGSTVNLKVNNPVTTANYFWYNSNTAISAIATGANTSTTSIPSDKTYYISREVKTGIGPVNKTALSSTGGYNNFRGNYIKINNSVPLTIETARLYIGNPGIVKFTLAKIISEDATTGQYTYQPLAVTSLDVYPTTTDPKPGSVNGNTSADTGAIYRINLPVKTIGDQVIIIECLNSPGRFDSATIFRNSSIVGTTYPISISNVMSITGSSAPAATANQWYYFLYDTKISTGCTSDKIPVIATTNTPPSISIQGDSIVSSSATGNQWYVNDTAIAGATGKNYKPVKSGTYKVINFDVFGCQQISNSVNFNSTVTATIDVLAQEIKLKVSPNPSNGNFHLSFEVGSRANLSIELLNAAGRKVYGLEQANFTGKFSKNLNLSWLNSAFYLLKITHNKQNYLQKILIQH